MKAKHISQNRNYRWWLRFGDILFPSLSELQFVIATSTLISLCIVDPSVVKAFIDQVIYEPRILIFIGIALFVLRNIFRRKVMSDSDKKWACILYFGFFAFLAISALDSLDLSYSHDFSFELINHWLINIILCISILRGAAALFLTDDGDSPHNLFLTQNFRDTQYKPIALILAGLLTFFVILILRNYYTDAATLGVLTFSYTNGFMLLLKPLFRYDLEYK